MFQKCTSPVEKSSKKETWLLYQPSSLQQVREWDHLYFVWPFEIPKVYFSASAFISPFNSQSLACQKKKNLIVDGKPRLNIRMESGLWECILSDRGSGCHSFMVEEIWILDLSLCISSLAHCLHSFCLTSIHWSPVYLLGKILGALSTTHCPCVASGSLANIPGLVLHSGVCGKLYFCGPCRTVPNIPLLTKLKVQHSWKVRELSERRKEPKLKERQFGFKYEIHPKTENWISCELLLKYAHMRLMENFAIS